MSHDSRHYYVRLGLFGQIGRLSAVDGIAFERGRRAVCRTRRGLEVGQILGVAKPDDDISGTLLRHVTPEDDLILARLAKNRDEAFQRCSELLREREVSASLVDVEQLFDGSSIYFYFLGEVTAAVDAITLELAEAYETKVQMRQFADAVERGCGPDCGTESASGCGSEGGCSTCSVAAACRVSPE